MSVDELRPYFGVRCYVRLRCRACLIGHGIMGRLEEGRHVGDVAIEGHTFSLEDIEGVSLMSGGPPRRIRLRVLFVSHFARLRRTAGSFRGTGGLRVPEGGAAG